MEKNPKNSGLAKLYILAQNFNNATFMHIPIYIRKPVF